MNTPTSSFLSKIKNFVDTFLIPILRSMIGKWDWQPPTWLSRIFSPVGNLIQALVSKTIAWKEKSAKQFYLACCLLLAAIAGSYKGYLWYVNLPKPDLVSFSIKAPEATSTYQDKKPRPFVVTFTGSAAPLELIGKEVKKNFTITPELPSTLKWISDTQLELSPQGDWSIGKDYEIKFKPNFFASHIILGTYQINLSTPELSYKITKSSFYEDPTNPKIKKVVSTINFTHPINKSVFEKNISLKMRVEPVKSFEDPEVKNLGFKVSYNDTGLEAYVHSEQIDIPDNTGEVLFTLAKGIPTQSGDFYSKIELKKTIRIPGIEDYFRITEIDDSINNNEKDEPEHIATLKASTTLKTSELSKKIKVYQLPKDKPALGNDQEVKNYSWQDPLEVTTEIISKSKRTKISFIPTELEFSNEQSFKFEADNGSYLFVVVESGLRSFGDYPLTKDYKNIIQVDNFPRMLKIMSEGGLLSLSGEKKLSIVSRFIPEYKIEINRLLPSTVNNLIATTSGNFQTPYFNYSSSGANGFGIENIAEKFTEIKQMPNPKSTSNEYSLIDFQNFMKKENPPKGLFYVKLSPYEKEPAPKKKEVVTVNPYDTEENQYEYEDNNYEEGYSEDQVSDQRLVLITDLGILVKETASGSKDVFIMSLKEGKPVAGAKVEIIGKNGLALFSETSSEDGKVSFPDAVDFKNERAPIAYVAQKDDDFSFLPYNRSDRKINFSRFDTGGTYDKGRTDAILGYAFSDRGVYRPGDQVNLGFVIKQLNWQSIPDGLPLELSVTNPKGSEILKQTLKFSPSGFKDYQFQTLENGITGRYTFSLYIQNDGKRGAFLASTSTKVEEFQPDRLKVKSKLNKAIAKGWIDPLEVKALINAENLFGTPAVSRKVKGQIKLYPGYNYFNEYHEYSFYTPTTERSNYEEELGEQNTNDQGNVEFDLGLDKYVQNLYSLSFNAEVFEEGSGRSVATSAAALVSDKKYIIGYKPDDYLGFIPKGNKRKINIIALNPNLDKIALNKISVELIETKYISTLTKQADGTFAYESTAEENSLGTKELKLNKDGLDYALDTSNPGSFKLLIRNSDGEIENELSYNVTGDANISTNLEKKAELEVISNKKEYSPLEEIELNIKVPYTGAGLITIERDKVYAYKWFQTNSTSSIQKIQVPAELEGNGYVTINFVRGLDSKEIFMSPLSYSSIPFSISKAKHTEKIDLKVPETIKPGDTLKINYKTEHPTDLIVFAVDEGILQFGKYKTPDPLSHFYQKRALEVKTSQILDLLLPEYSILKELSAAGGDQGVAISKHLNPFKRKNQKPVVYWSGIISSNGEQGTLEYHVPEYFNGSIKVMAIAVSANAIGVAETRTSSKADFIIQPNVPYFAAPGDEFEVGALVANNLKENSKLTFEIETCPSLTTMENKTQVAEINANADKALNFKVKAIDTLGACSLRFLLKDDKNKVIASNSVEMSIRPAQPFITKITSKQAQKGFFSGNQVEIIPQRKMYPQLRTVDASASILPLSLAKGFVEYLKSYPHGCSEQVVTQAFPGVVLGVKPEFGLDNSFVKPKVDYAIRTLLGRQNSEGAFGLWSNGSDTSDFVNVYATHFLTEAKEHGYEIPNQMMISALDYLKTFVSQKYTENYQIRAQAYALYILSRNGILTTNWLSALREQLENQNDKSWKKEITGLYLAATYKLLKLDRDAEKLIKYIDPKFETEIDYNNYFDPIVYKANYFYVVSKHFPEIAKSFSGEEIADLVKNFDSEQASTIDIGYTLLALNEYSKQVAKPEDASIKIAQIFANNKLEEFKLGNTLFPSVAVSADALKVTYEGSSKAPLFYQLSESGFDITAPSEITKSKIELIHELKNEKGEVAQSIGIEEKLYVHLLVRALDKSYPNVAVIDLLPGGFELDLGNDELSNRISAIVGEDTWTPSFIDAREDRLLFYGYLGDEAKRFIYRIKPINKGKYQVPPAYGEGMYDRSVVGYSKAGSIEVK